MTKSLIPDAPLIASFDERKTKNIVTMFPSKQHMYAKEDQQTYCDECPKLRVLYAGPTTRAVRRTFADAGFMVTPKDSLAFNVCWGSPKGLEFYSTLVPGQYCNQVPGSNGMGRKDTLAIYLRAAHSRFPKLYNFTPKTFLVPQNLRDLRDDMDDALETDQMYIYKPALGARGNGIQILGPADDIPNPETSAVVQRYIMNPLLLHGYKFDLRIYILVTSVDPLIFYIYDQGLGRFATEKYIPPDEINKMHTQMHLTNFSVNYKSENFVDGDKVDYRDTESFHYNVYRNPDDDKIVQLKENFPSKWKLQELLAYLDENREAFDDTPESIINNIPEQIERGYYVRGSLRRELYRRIKDVITKTIVAVEPRMFQSSERAGTLHCYPRRNFGLYGADIMFDKLGNPYLIEINSSPATGTATELDVEIKFELLHDVMNLVGVQVNLDDNQEIICPTRYFCSEDAKRSRQMGMVQNAQIKKFTLGKNEEMFSMTLKGLLNGQEGEYYNSVDYTKLTRFEKRAIL